MKFVGRCLCGVIEFEAFGRPIVVAQCHCEECRRLSGAGRSVGAVFDRSSVSIEGTWQEFSYKSLSGSMVTRAFCPNCGSSLFGFGSSTPNRVTIAMGALDGPNDLRIDVVVFDRAKQCWDHLGENVVIFETQPD